MKMFDGTVSIFSNVRHIPHMRKEFDLSWSVGYIWLLLMVHLKVEPMEKVI